MTAPANNNWADATVLTGTSGSDTATDNTDATLEGDEPAVDLAISGVDGTHTVWYAWTAPADGTITFDTLGSTKTGGGEQDTVLHVFVGSTLAGLSLVGDNDDSGIHSTSSVTVDVTNTTTYYARVNGFHPAQHGPVVFNWSFTIAPVELLGDDTIHYTSTATLSIPIRAVTGTGWGSNNTQHYSAATISVGDTTIDGLTFTLDDALLDPDPAAPPSLPDGPAAHRIRRMWLDVSGPPTFDEHHQPHAGSWPGTGGDAAEAHYADWGHYRIKVGTKNVTSFRGVQTLILQLSETDPFGYDTCSLLFPAIGPYEHLGQPGSDTHWLPGTDDDRHIPIDIKHVHPDGTIGVHFEGDISNIADAYDGRTGPLQVNGTGTLKTLDQRITKPRFNSDPIDIGHLIHRWTKYEVKYGWHGHPCPAHTTGIKTAERGGYGDPLMTTTVQNLLATAQAGDNTKWTLRNHHPRGMRLHVRDLTTVHFTLWCGQPGVTHQLTRDLDHAVRVIFGEGTDHGTQFWRNTQYPNLQDNPPAYPLGDGAVFTPGGSHTGFQEFSDELNSRGYNLDSDDTYLASDAGNIRAFQSDAGITVDGDVGPQTWNAAFGADLNANVLDAYIRPLAVASAAEPFLYNARGGRIGRNPDYDHRTRREKLEQYGTMSKADARRSAHLEMPVVAHADYAGTVTLTNIDPPELGALSIRAGMNFLFKGHRNTDRLLHVAKVDKNPGMQTGSARTVAITTSERGDDYVTLAARLQRNRDVVDTSGRRRPSHRSARRTPDFAPWDSESGAGFLAPHAQFGGLWNVYPIPAGELGPIVHVRLEANTPTLIAAAVFNRLVTPRELVRLPGLADPSSGAVDGSDPWVANAKRLTRNLKFRDQPWMAWATGGPGAMQGYWPNQPVDDESKVTGVLDDSSPWNFHSARTPWLWLAVWTRDSCRISGDPKFKHRALFPGPPQ